MPFAKIAKLGLRLPNVRFILTTHFNQFFVYILHVYCRIVTRIIIFTNVVVGVVVEITPPLPRD